MSDPVPAHRLQAAYRLLAVMFGLIMGLSVMAFALWKRSSSPPTTAAFRGAGADENLVRKLYPAVQFTNIYPDMTAAEIDRLQRECSAIRYAYEPFVQFLPRPMAATYLHIDDHGIRRNHPAIAAPWPPDPTAVNIFVFGGSTTLGYHLRDDQTVPARLEATLRARFSNTNLHCYNLGSGYHFSSQERARFAALLAENEVPHIAIFIDGLNEFYHPGGVPQYTFDLHRFTAPDGRVPNRLLFQNHREFNDQQREALIKLARGRYQRNVQMCRALGDRARIKTLFVAQPVPFYSFPIDNAEIHPFHQPEKAAEDRLCLLGYPRLQEYAASGAFGTNFLWAAEIFKDAQRPMYADKVHYSPEGADVFARFIADGLVSQGIIGSQATP